MMLRENSRDAAGEQRENGSVHVPELILYEQIDFGGASWRSNLGHCALIGSWSHGFASLIVVSGTWVFYDQPDFTGASKQLDPGYYRCITDAGLPSSQIASFRPIAF